MPFFVKKIDEGDPSDLAKGWYVFRVGTGVRAAGPFPSQALAAAVAMRKNKELERELTETLGNLSKLADEKRRQLDEVKNQIAELDKQRVKQRSKRLRAYSLGFRR